jgi:hypothetical protein
MRFFSFRAKVRKIAAVADVEGHPELFAVLYKGDSYYTYYPRKHPL